MAPPAAAATFEADRETARAAELAESADFFSSLETESAAIDTARDEALTASGSTVGKRAAGAAGLASRFRTVGKIHLRSFVPSKRDQTCPVWNCLLKRSSTFRTFGQPEGCCAWSTKRMSVRDVDKNIEAKENECSHPHPSSITASLKISKHTEHVSSSSDIFFLSKNTTWSCNSRSFFCFYFSVFFSEGFGG